MLKPLKKQFRRFMVRTPSEAEKALIDWDIDYVHRKFPDGSETFHVKGDLNIAGLGLKQLPDLSNVIVSGDFNCSGNLLTTLEGSPNQVGGSFLCSQNMLTSLKGCAPFIRGAFDCSDNKLTSLEHGPERIGSKSNDKYVLDYIDAGYGYLCDRNNLNSLEHAPVSFGFLKTDFGVFMTPDEIPQSLSASSAARVPAEQASGLSLSLEEKILVRGPVKLRPM